MHKLVLVIIGLMLCVLNQSVYAATGRVLKDLCNDPRYFCTKVESGESWESLFTDSETRKIVMTVNRMNIQLRPGMIIAVPKNLGAVSLNELSPFGNSIPSKGEPVLIYDPTQLAWGAFDASGLLVRWGGAAGGSDWCRDLGRSCHTSVGTHRIYSKGGADCTSRKFPIPDGGAPMPYCMFFSSGQAFHGSPHEVPGFNASHGCVRLFVDDALWLRDNFTIAGSKGTLVIIRPYTQRSSSGSVWDEKGT